MADGCAHEAEAGGLKGAALLSHLAAAETRLAEDDQRLTAPRRRVLHMLLEAGQPVKAYDLIAGYGEDGEPAKPPTVYRALEFLERQGFVHRIESLNAFVACERGEVSHAAAFLICDCCGRSQEIAPVAAEALNRAAEGAGYELSAITMEAHGLCGDCRG
ncbi:MAG TPA: Fur family transcriptional regulator [Caulobacteraceae bacterium]|jgi:Fur family zinc uptake transcriptional regulator